MNRLRAFVKARELFAHQRILVFWLVALIALAAPWLWFALTDQEQAPGEASGTAVVERRE